MQRSLTALGAGIVVAGFGIHGFAAPAHAAPQLSPLVSPAELAAFKRDADLLLLDIRQGEASEGVSVYEAGHIPGAVHAPYARWRGPAEKSGAGAHGCRADRALPQPRCRGRAARRGDPPG